MRDKVKRGGGRNQAKADIMSLIDGNDAVGMKHHDDTSFPVKIQGAGVEPFELQVHGFWLVQDAVMALLSRDEVCPRSNLSLALAGTTLDPLAELQSLKGLKPGAILRLVEEPYTAHSARLHLARVLELLRASGPQDALREGRSPSILETLTQTQTPADSSLPNGKSLKRSSSNTKTEATNQDGAPPEYLLPGSSERPLMALLPHSSQPEAPSYLKDLSLSCWSPVPGHRKLQGDFLYITVVTMEGRRCDITSCPKGFFLNRSTEEVFDPRPAQSSSVCHSFTDLLCHISPAFKQTLTTLKNRSQLPTVEVMPTPYHTLSWLGPPCAARTHKNTFSRLGVDDQPATQAPDWNEELQAARDLPQGSLEERLKRDRALLQVNSAFVRAVTQGAETVVDGFVDPVNGNPDDPAFLWGGLFMSQGAANAMFGGDRGRRTAQRLELKGVQAYSDIQGLEGLHTLPTAIVDYRGVRLSAQGLAPGLEGSEQDQATAPASRGLLYGLSAGPQESPQRRRMLELLAMAARTLSLQKHVVMGADNRRVSLFTSVDAQGLLGADGRLYILDVFRTFPADANFCPEEEKKESQTGEEESHKSGEEEEEEEEEEEKKGWPENYHSDSGLPKSFLHGLCRLRQELVQAFIQHKHCQFSQHVRETLDGDGGFEECATASDSRGTKAVRAACKEVGSVSNIIFEMRFNPSVFSSVSFPPAESQSNKLQERLLREAAAFIVTHQIPAFMEYCLQHSEAPMDGVSLKEMLHQKGINLRYMGHVITAISQSEHKERLRHIMRTVIGEIFTRSTRRVFNNFLQGVDVPSLSAAVSHFLCCLLVPHFTPTPVGEETKKKSRRRGRGTGASESMPWSTLTGAELWNLVSQDAAETYDISDSLGSGLNHLVEHYSLQKVSLLRDFCLKTGVQLRLRDYILDNHNKAPIGPDDILNIFPVVKHIHMPVVDASKAYRAAQNFIQKGLLDQAHEHLKEATYLYGRVCDDLNPEACHCHSLLAKVAFVQGKPAEARCAQLKAVVISERVFGFDHPNTIHQYALLGVFVFAGGETALAQKCLLRARHLMLTVHGEDHPYTAILDSCLGLVLTGDQRGQFLRNALRLNTSFFGPSNLHTALNQHLLAQWMCSKGDYRSAMTHEKDALTAFTSMFGEDHPQTSCSKEFLCTITKQAVKVERSLRQAGAECTEQTVECITPTSDTVLEQMVLVTGIRSITHRDGLQEYKRKHKELKAAVAKELGLIGSNDLDLSEILNGEEKSSNQEAGSGKEAEDGGSTEVENNRASQQEQPVAETLAKSAATTSSNGHVAQPAEENQHEEKEDGGDGDRAASGAQVIIVNGKSEETETSAPNEVNTANGEVRCDATVDEMKSGEVHVEVNGACDIPVSPSVLKSKGTWADVVSKANGAGDINRAVNGGADKLTANGEAEYE